MVGAPKQWLGAALDGGCPVATPAVSSRRVYGEKSGPQTCGKRGRGGLAPLHQLVFNPWAERRFFSLKGAYFHPGSDDLSASCQAPWGAQCGRMG